MNWAFLGAKGRIDQLCLTKLLILISTKQNTWLITLSSRGTDPLSCILHSTGIWKGTFNYFWQGSMPQTLTRTLLLQGSFSHAGVNSPGLPQRKTCCWDHTLRGRQDWLHRWQVQCRIRVWSLRFQKWLINLRLYQQRVKLSAWNPMLWHH